MTRQALIEREKKRKKLEKQFSSKRALLKAIIDNSNKSEEERYSARLELHKLPRNSNPTRRRNRCTITGRPRGTFRQFGLGRTKIREIAFRGEIPGITKASW